MINLKTLVVDDDRISLKLVEHGLKHSGCEVDTAENGIAACDLISKYHYDVILTDLQMPGNIDGIGVLEAAKAKSGETEVILITAYASVDNAVEAMKKGASDYLQKPVNFDELMLKLDKIHNLKKLLKDARDLREAMDVTEKGAGQTIQDLELRVAQLQNTLAEIKKMLSKEGIDASERIQMVLDLLQTS